MVDFISNLHLKDKSDSFSVSFQSVLIIRLDKWQSQINCEKLIVITVLTF